MGINSSAENDYNAKAWCILTRIKDATKRLGNVSLTDVLTRHYVDKNNTDSVCMVLDDQPFFSDHRPSCDVCHEISRQFDTNAIIFCENLLIFRSMIPPDEVCSLFFVSVDAIPLVWESLADIVGISTRVIVFSRDTKKTAIVNIGFFEDVIFPDAVSK